jgi:hypothetical protein
METPFKNPLGFLDSIHWPLPFSEEYLGKTPEAYRTITKLEGDDEGIKICLKPKPCSIREKMGGYFIK